MRHHLLVMFVERGCAALTNSSPRHRCPCQVPGQKPELELELELELVLGLDPTPGQGQ